MNLKEVGVGSFVKLRKRVVIVADVVPAIARGQVKLAKRECQVRTVPSPRWRPSF